VEVSIVSAWLNLANLVMALSRIGSLEMLGTLSRVSRTGTNFYKLALLFRSVLSVEMHAILWRLHSSMPFFAV